MSVTPSSSLERNVTNYRKNQARARVAKRTALLASGVTEDLCDLKYFNASALKHELITGTKCTICNRSFINNEVLKRHYGIHDGKYSNVCTICGTGFNKFADLKDHKTRVHKTPKSDDMVCRKCDGVFYQAHFLKKHEELCICPKNDTPMQCLLCVRTFNTWQQIKSHVWTHLSKCSFCDEKISGHVSRVLHMVGCQRNPLYNSECIILTS